MGAGGLVLRSGGVVLRFIQFAAAIVILGIFSFFLATQHRQGDPIITWERAVEGITGAAALYTLFGIILTCFLGGVSFFASLAVILDFCFIGGNIAIAIETRGGNQDCSMISDGGSLRYLDPNSDNINNPYGMGDPSRDYVPSLYHTCTLTKACFAIAIIQAILFFLSIFYQLAIVRHHRNEKRHGAGPNTPVVAGQRRAFWRRKARADVEKDGYGGAYQNGNGYQNNAVNY